MDDIFLHENKVNALNKKAQKFVKELVPNHLYPLNMVFVIEDIFNFL